jgi:hypothetical protein
MNDTVIKQKTKTKCVLEEAALQHKCELQESVGGVKAGEERRLFIGHITILALSFFETNGTWRSITLNEDGIEPTHTEKTKPKQRQVVKE